MTTTTKPASGPQATRRFIVGDHVVNQRKFAPNSVYTTKYNLFTFFPKFFLEQFSKTSNSFFLVTSSLQQIEGLAPTNRFATMIGLGFVLSVSAAKEIWEDWRRRQSDQTANHSPCKVYKEGLFESKRWSQVVVGDVVRVEKDEDAPADLVILCTSEPASLCYLETANIDGETNLKIRTGLYSDVQLPDLLKRCQNGIVEFECEVPNSRIDGFEGVLYNGANEKTPVGTDNMLIRGARLRNTTWLVGIVVYTGADTKIMQNTQDRELKVTRMERIYNQQTVLLFCLLLLCIVVNFYMCRQFEVVEMPTHWYLSQYLSTDWKSVNTVVYRFMVFCLLYHNFVPINLNITVEMVRLFLGHAISSDRELLEVSEGTALAEVPTVCRTSTLVEELGQVKYVFADKTGTLTRNEMRLKHVAVDQSVLVDIDSTVILPESKDAEMFFMMLAVCHTVVVDRHCPTSLHYQASSPDEAAIVHGARQHLNWTFVDRDHKKIYCQSPRGAIEMTVLAVLEFTSERRRMSMLVEWKGEWWLLSKGADDVLLERSCYIAGSVMSGLDRFGADGMRTLCFAYKRVDQMEGQLWLTEYYEASCSVTDRQSKIGQVCDKLERDWRVVGVTAVEDRLQEQVVETLCMLRQAGMSVWMLTGDRPETALNIARSCGLLEGQLVDLTSSSDHNFIIEGPYSVLVEGSFIQNNTSNLKYRDLLLKSDSVICCRTSPNQKALLVNMVKQSDTGICLAIGDGANDVSMIRAAHIGVGLAGREGVQAARSADFAIQRFRMLQHLLLVHGSLGYQRLSKVFLYCMYKNLMLYSGQLWCARVCGWSGQAVYDGWFLSLYNIAFAAGAIVVLGVMERYVPADRLLAFPGLYKTGPMGRFFNRRSYWGCALNSLWHSTIIVFVVKSAFNYNVVQADNQAAGLWAFGSTIFAVSLITVTLKIFVIANYWTTLLFAVAASGPLCWFLYCFVANWLSLKHHRFMLIGGLSDGLLVSPSFYACLLLAPTLCLTRDFLWKFYKRSYTPLDHHIVQEWVEMERKATMEKEKRVKNTSGHGFAFSQSEGQARVLKEGTVDFLRDPFRLISNFAITNEL